MTTAERREIAQVVNEAVKRALEGLSEKWLTGKQLSEQFGMFNHTWLKTYGHLLPRTRVTVTGEDGVHSTGWAYPMHKIQRMIGEQKINFINQNNQEQ